MPDDTTRQSRATALSPLRLVPSIVVALGLAAIVAACSGGEGASGAATGSDSRTATTSIVGTVPEPDGEPGAGAEALLDELSPVAEATAGQLVWVHEDEPPDLHVDDPDNGTLIAAWIRQGLLEGLFGVDTGLGWYPELLAEEPQLTVNNSGTVDIQYRLRPDLRWSDGTPLTSADVAYTHDIIAEGCETEADGSIVDNSTEGCQYEMGSRVGYDLVTSFEVVDEQVFTVSFAAFYPAWRDLYHQVFAAHAFGTDAFTVNQNLRTWRSGPTVLPSSGPLVFERWTEGRSMVLARNDDYHGSASPDATNTGPATVDGVLVAFVADRQTRIDLLLAGDAHMMMTEPDAAYARLAASDGFTVAAAPGPVFEHWGFNLLDPHLAKPEVREAVAFALDKSEMVEKVWAPLFGEALPAAGAGNAFWMPSQAPYEDHQAAYAGSDVAAAAARLTEAGYARGSDGIWEHPEDGRLRLRAGTTGGSELRELQLEIGRAQLAEAGIEVVIENEPGGLFLSQGPFSPEAIEASTTAGASGNGDAWDIAQFSWTTGPWPGRVAGAFRSGSGTNPYAFANPEFDVAAAGCDAVADDNERASCYNNVDRFVTTLDEGTDGLFVIPITQRPRFYGYSEGVAAIGAAPDVVAGGPLVNVVDARLR